MQAQTFLCFRRRSHRPIVFLVAAFAALAVTCVAPANAQFHDWSQRFGGAGVDRAEQIAVDPWGNIVITGLFSGTADFGGGPLATGGSEDVFVAMYDRWGNHLWSRRFGSNGGDAGLCVAADGLGNVIVGGYFLGTVDFGGGTLTSAGLYDIFIAKFDGSGHHLWSLAFGGTNNDLAEDVSVDALGRLTVTGSFRETIDFGGGPLASAGDADGFLATFDADGNHVWSRRFGADLTDSGHGVATDPAGNVFVTGAFQDTVSFGGDSLVSAGLNDIFIAKFDAAGAPLWSRGFGDWTFQAGTRVAADLWGNVAVVGAFFGTIDFGGGPLTSAGLWDAFVATFDADGDHVWSRSFGGSFDDRPLGVTIRDNGDVTVTGTFGGTVDMGGGSLTSAGGSDAFVACYDSSNNHLWSHRFGSGGADAGRSVAMWGTDFVVFAGEFTDSVDVGGGSLEGAGAEDVYLSRQWVTTPTAVGSPQAAADGIDVYPNPFNPSTTIAYTVAADGPVTIAVFDVMGRLVETLVENEFHAAGEHRFDYHPRSAASGIYFLRAQTARGVSTRRVTLLK